MWIEDATIEAPLNNSCLINVRLDHSVESVSRSAACHLSSVIANGMFLSQNNDVTIHKDHIDFGRCANPEIQGMSGNIAPIFIWNMEMLYIVLVQTLNVDGLVNKLTM